MQSLQQSSEKEQLFAFFLFIDRLRVRARAGKKHEQLFGLHREARPRPRTPNKKKAEPEGSTRSRPEQFIIPLAPVHLPSPWRAKVRFGQARSRYTHAKSHRSKTYSVVNTRWHSLRMSLPR